MLTHAHSLLHLIMLLCLPQLSTHSGCSGLVVEHRTRNRDVAGSTQTRSTASNLEQVANLMYVQANSASYPQWDGKWVVSMAMGRGEGLVWLIGAMVCLIATPWYYFCIAFLHFALHRVSDENVQWSVSVGNRWPHNVLRHHWLMPISCHFWDCKALLVTSLTHVSGTIASVQTFTFITWDLLNRSNYTDAMHLRTWPDCNRCTINSMMMMMPLLRTANKQNKF